MQIHWSWIKVLKAFFLFECVTTSLKLQIAVLRHITENSRIFLKVYSASHDYESSRAFAKTSDVNLNGDENTNFKIHLISLVQPHIHTIHSYHNRAFINIKHVFKSKLLENTSSLFKTTRERTCLLDIFEVWSSKLLIWHLNQTYHETKLRWDQQRCNVVVCNNNSDDDYDDAHLENNDWSVDVTDHDLRPYFEVIFTLKMAFCSPECRFSWKLCVLFLRL